MVVVFIVTFFVFIPLAVRRLTGDRMMTAIAFFSGLLLLPLNHLSPSTYIHPTSQALMYAPVFLFAFFLLYRRRTWRVSALFLVLAVFYTLLHPQQAANLLLFFGVVAVLQVGSHLYRGYGLSRVREWVLPEVTFYACVFWIWVRVLDHFWSSLQAVVTIPFRDTQPAETTVTRTFSLTTVGGSLAEVFMKLFFVSLLFALLTGLLMLYELFRRRGYVWSTSSGGRVTSDGGVVQSNLGYVFYGVLSVVVIFLVYLIGGISDQYFRQLGMLMVLASILTSIALGRILHYLTGRYSLPVGRSTVGAFLLVCLVLTIPVAFASPYIFYSSDHVPEKQMDGYETTFEYQSDSIAFADIRSSAYRHGHAIQGKEIPTDAYYATEERGIPDHFANRALPTFYENATYIPVTEADRKRDAVLWRGFRFSHEDFAYLNREPRIDRVQTNGGYDLYLLNE
jgi:hypothetical protein